MSVNGNGSNVGTCTSCGRQFSRPPRSKAGFCSETCRRKAKAKRERLAYNERKHVTSQVVTRTVTEVRAQVEQDESHQRPAQWPTLGGRLAGLHEAHEAMLANEFGARYAFRQSLLDTAAAAIQLAARLPAPTVKVRAPNARECPS